MKLEFPYKVVGGNSVQYILEYTLNEDAKMIQNIVVTDDGITIRSADCLADPDMCKAGALAFADALAKQYPEMDVAPMREAFESMEFSAENTSQERNYVFIHKCEVVENAA